MTAIAFLMLTSTIDLERSAQQVDRTHDEERGRLISATALSSASRDPAETLRGSPNLALEISGKQLELLKEIVPRLSRVAVIGTSTVPGYPTVFRETELAANTFGVKLQYLDVLDSKDVETAFRAAVKGRAGAV